jgi:hypothetical protein
LGHQSLDDQRFTHERLINQFETYTQTNHKRTTDIHASKIDEETRERLVCSSMPDLNLANPLCLTT